MKNKKKFQLSLIIKWSVFVYRFVVMKETEEGTTQSRSE